MGKELPGAQQPIKLIVDEQGDEIHKHPAIHMLIRSHICPVSFQDIFEGVKCNLHIHARLEELINFLLVATEVADCVIDLIVVVAIDDNSIVVNVVIAYSLSIYCCS